MSVFLSVLGPFGAGTVPPDPEVSETTRAADLWQGRTALGVETRCSGESGLHDTPALLGSKPVKPRRRFGVAENFNE